MHATHTHKCILHFYDEWIDGILKKCRVKKKKKKNYIHVIIVHTQRSDEVIAYQVYTKDHPKTWYTCTKEKQPKTWYKKENVLYICKWPLSA